MNFKSLVSFISRLSPRERVIFYATVGVLVIVFLDRAVMSPILSKIDQLNESIQAEEDEIEQGMVIVDQEKRIEKESAMYTAYLSQPQSEEKEVTAFLSEVEDIAKRSSVYITDIKPSGKDTEHASVRYFIKLNFEAQMEQVVNFFYTLSNFEKLIMIEDFQVRPKSEGSSIIICVMTVSKAIISE